MAFVLLDRKKLKSNYNYLDKIFNKHNIEWAVVTKMLCGNKAYLKEVIDLTTKEVCDSRVSNLKTIKNISKDVQTIYIKPPAKRAIKSVVKYADISLNTQLSTIELLSEEAQRQNKIHKVIIMLEMGELREGVMRNDVIDFYEEIFKLPNISVLGIGTNLTCLYGVLPNQDKLIQLNLYKQLIEAKFNRKIKYVSGGSSVTIPLIKQKLLPKGINHFRVGETLFMGTNVYDGSKLEEMENDVLKLYAEIIELTKKPTVPEGDMGLNVEGKSFEFDKDEYGKKSYRAILDVGLLDIETEHLTPVDPNVEVAGASSDMIVMDLDKNEQNYQVGDLLEFNVDYMGALRLFNSNYIDKRVV
jgi:ornithine racemase